MSNENLNKAREEYQRKLKSGEIIKTPAKNPREKWEENKKSLRASINYFCWDCVGEIIQDIRECTAVDCPLWHVRPYQR